MRTLLMVIVVMAISVICGSLMADTGWEGAQRIERGAYVQTRSITITTYTATEFMPSTVKRPDSLCKNYSDYTVFIGSATSPATYLITIGLPIGASEYFKLDGSMTGSIAAISEAAAGSATVKIKCLDGLVW